MKRALSEMIVAVAVVATTAAVAGAGSRGKVDLTPSSGAPAAGGRAKMSLKSTTDGTFEVRTRRLEPETGYDLLVGGVRVGTVTTSRGGSGKLRFSNPPRHGRVLLGFDPRGESIEVRSSSGEDVLSGTMPSLGDDPTDLTCCIPDDQGAECEDRTQAECDAAGGTVVTASSCLPDPCGATPPAEVDAVCCIPDDAGPECEDRTQAECTAAGGSLVEATSCTPNPCQGTPLPPDDDVQCCIPAYYVFSCEDRTVEECASLGGQNRGPGDCSTNPCGDLPPPAEHGVCCLPNAAGDEIECEDRSPTVCVAAGGTVKPVGTTCAPDPCGDVLPPNPDVMCCVPNATGDESECEDLTASACAAAGGTNLGAGICAPDTCGADPGPDIQCCEIHSNAWECRARTVAECTANSGVNVGDGPCGPTSCDGL